MFWWMRCRVISIKLATFLRKRKKLYYAPECCENIDKSQYITGRLFCQQLFRKTPHPTHEPPPQPKPHPPLAPTIARFDQSIYVVHSIS